MTTPPIRYAENGDVHIAYQVVGEGPLDLVLVMGARSRGFRANGGSTP
jgi:hypothetical protein